MITEASRVPLTRRAWIADGVRGALVTSDGTIDWYCPSGFGADPDCWRLLDPAGAAVRVGPVRDGTGATRSLPSAHQAYLRATNVVETVLHGRAGRRVSVTDVLPWYGPEQEGGRGILRFVRALSGPVEVEVEVIPGGLRSPAREVSTFADGLVAANLEVRGIGDWISSPLGRDRPRWRATRTLDAGEALIVTVGIAGATNVATVDGARRIIDNTSSAWRSWLDPSWYDGPYRAAVQRSLLAVRSLMPAAGGLASAGTTSLPRRAGGERTSDGRWVQVRGVASAVGALAAAGFAEDAEAAEGWLREAVSLLPLPWPASLGPDGQPAPELEELDLQGWRRSQPVVVGRAPDVLDLGLLADVAVSIGASTTGPGGRRGDAGPLSAAWDGLAAAADWLSDHWQEPDAGRWEIRGAPRHLVASKLDAWVALDHMTRVARERNPLDLQAAAWHREASAVVGWLEHRAIAADGGLRSVAPTGEAGTAGPGDSASPDASLLEIAWRGPWPVGHPFVGATIDRVLEHLSDGPFLYRYSDRFDDGYAGPDSPDLVASLWAVRALAAVGRWEEAHERMEAVCGLGGGLGLLSEAVDPVTSELMGNFPSATAHVALLEAAHSLLPGPA